MLNRTPHPVPSTPTTDAECRFLEAYFTHLNAEKEAQRKELLSTVDALYDEELGYGPNYISTPLRLIRAICVLIDDPMTLGNTREFVDATLELASELESVFGEDYGYERPSALLRAALNNQHGFEFSIEEAREAHPGLSDLDAMRHTALDCIREQRYAAWGDGLAK